MRLSATALMTTLSLTALSNAAVTRNATSPTKLEAYPTYRAVGVEAAYEGDGNENGRAEMFYRRLGQREWRRGVELTPDRKRRTWCGSVFPLAEGEQLEIRVVFSDPDNNAVTQLATRVTVRRIVTQASGGRTVFVSAEGRDGNPGTRGAPLRTIGAAAQRVKNGGTVWVTPGVYRESITLEGFQGKAHSPIVFAAAGKERPFIDGSVVLPKDPSRWLKHGDAIYFTELDFTPLYVAEDGMRMYLYRILGELETGRVKAAKKVRWSPWSVARGWHYDKKSKRLYLKTTTGDNPGKHEIRVVRHLHAFKLNGCEHVVIKGLEMGYYGESVVRITGGSVGNMLVDNVIHHAPNGVRISGAGTDDNLAYRNLVYELGLQDFCWTGVKASRYGRQGFTVHAGRGNSIVDNEVHGWFDGIAAVTWKNPDRVEKNRDMDIIGNFIHDGGDDGLEPDGGGVNMRIWDNRITRMLVGISLAPIERGPVYVVRNRMWNTGWGTFKLGVGECTSLGPCYVYHNSSYGTSTAISFPPLPPKGIPFSGKVFKNNAFVVKHAGLAQGRPDNVLDYNVYYAISRSKHGHQPRMQWLRVGSEKGEFERYEKLGAFTKATGQEAHGICADPGFLDAPAGDFRLKPNSPAIDRGIVIPGINDGFLGLGPDIGAVETR